jgi:hypothetical protein
MRNRIQWNRILFLLPVLVFLAGGISGCGAGPVSKEVQPIAQPPQGPPGGAGLGGSAAPSGAESGAPSGAR